MSDNKISQIVLSELEQLKKLLIQQEGLECDIQLEGQEVFSLYGNRAALIHIATRILELVDNGQVGKHFTIDKADIAPDSECSITIALKDYSGI